ncbi:hypothetical protein GCM10027299_44030 [Larkinella ripae]
MKPFYLLVADDHVDIGKLLLFTIRLVYKDQVQVKVVLTVPDLQTSLALDEPLPDLLLLDYHLRPYPYNAPEVLVWLKHQEHLQAIPVQVWSSLSDGTEADRCRQLGAQGFTNKSNAMSDMVGFVKSLVILK